MNKNIFLTLIGFIITLCLTSQASAMILIHEILADPPAGIAGDANGDGIRSSSGDEFIELYNSGDSTVDLTGWYLTDAAQTRHIFHQTLGAGDLAVIFGKDASTGALSLNNSGDTISLFDLHHNLMDQVIYAGLANQNQSIVRSGNDWVLHSEVSDQLFSPGTLPAAAVPEPLSALTFSLGAIAALRKRRRN